MQGRCRPQRGKADGDVAQGPRQAQAGDAGVGADFSVPFVDGSPMNEPAVSTQQWLAALTRGDEVLGTLGVWRPGGGPAQPSGYSDDVAFGAALESQPPDVEGDRPALPVSLVAMALASAVAILLLHLKRRRRRSQADEQRLPGQGVRNSPRDAQSDSGRW